MTSWTDIAELALALPGTEASTSYGQASVKVRKKMFACAGKQDDHFLILLSHEEKHALIDNYPETFFETPHYEKSTAVQVRYGTADLDLVQVLLQRAWRQRASKAQRDELDAQ